MKNLKPRIFKHNGMWTYTFFGNHCPIRPHYHSWEACLWWALRVASIVNDGKDLPLEDFRRQNQSPTTWRSI